MTCIEAWQKENLPELRKAQFRQSKYEGRVTLVIYAFPLKGREREMFDGIECAILHTWKVLGMMKTSLVVSNAFAEAVEFSKKWDSVQLHVSPILVSGDINTMSLDCIINLHTYFTTQYCLVIQNDGLPLQDTLDQFLGKYDFIGAPMVRDGRRWLARTLHILSFNGGFSLRSHKICVNASRAWTRFWHLFVSKTSKRFLPEDGFYTIFARLNPFYRFAHKFPSEQEAFRFAYDELGGLIAPPSRETFWHPRQKNSWDVFGNKFIMTVEITDDFSIEKIIESGQCFRPKVLSDGCGFFVTENKFLKIREISRGRFEVSCSEREWRTTWTDYFDLKRSYSAIRKACAGRNAYIDAAMESGRGIRILRQAPWEMLVSFIVSQRKSIPAIRKTVEYFAEKYGSPIEGGVPVKAFPSAEQLGMATDAELRESGLGYRQPFIVDAVRRVREGEIDLASLGMLDDGGLVETLKTFHGVGNKVANCVALFAYARTGLAPVDVWIQRAIDDHFGGENIFLDFGAVAGIMQQYVFFHQRVSKI